MNFTTDECGRFLNNPNHESICFSTDETENLSHSRPLPPPAVALVWPVDVWPKRNTRTFPPAAISTGIHAFPFSTLSLTGSKAVFK